MKHVIWSCTFFRYSSRAFFSFASLSSRAFASATLQNRSWFWFGKLEILKICEYWSRWMLWSKIKMFASATLQNRSRWVDPQLGNLISWQYVNISQDKFQRSNLMLLPPFFLLGHLIGDLLGFSFPIRVLLLHKTLDVLHVPLPLLVLLLDDLFQSVAVILLGKRWCHF